MAVIVNRKYGSRLECLHTILKQIELNSKSYNFTFNDLKYDSEKKYTVMDCCPLLKENLGRRYCPYLENPLDDSKCYATQSINSDTTKSKAISDVG
ncbi:MAG TPA: hypothetical protein H9767_04230, partial [Candidatus Nosocomiicoccus stercorigallinarum]|nr:hypothetical protein [Candidatus Nosocomiicoccus stercorigallinarum]